MEENRLELSEEGEDGVRGLSVKHQVPVQKGKLSKRCRLQRARSLVSCRWFTSL